MKILYLTVPSYYDLEISLIRELSKYCEVEVLMIISPSSRNLSAFSISDLKDDPSIVNAAEWKEFEKYDNLINRRQWYIANNPTNSLKDCYLLSRLIRKFIKNNNYDLIHSTTDCKTSLFLLPLISRLKNTLFTTHDPLPHNDNSFIHYWFKERLVYECYSNLLFLSDSLVQQFKQRIPNKKLQIYFSRLGVYDFLRSYPVTQNKYNKYILFFGRIEDYKGVDLLVEAFRKTEAYKEGLKLIIAGKGNFSNKSIAETDANIILINKYIPNEELSSLIANCEFVVLPYKSATQSGCVMSSFAFNKPILATSVGDLPLEIEHKKTGIIVQPNDVTSLSKGIDELYLSELQQYSIFIQNKYNEEGELSWSGIAHKLENTYKNIISRNS